MAARKLRSRAEAALPATVAGYLATLTRGNRLVIEEARAFVYRHIPRGYAEFMNWGVINWGDPARAGLCREDDRDVDAEAVHRVLQTREGARVACSIVCGAL
jgi:hypothetical protein